MTTTTNTTKITTTTTGLVVAMSRSSPLLHTSLTTLANGTLVRTLAATLPDIAWHPVRDHPVFVKVLVVVRVF